MISSDVQPQPAPWGALPRVGDPVSDSLDRVAPRDLSGVHWSISSAGKWGARLSGFKPLFWRVQLGSSEFVCRLGVVTS